MLDRVLEDQAIHHAIVQTQGYVASPVIANERVLMTSLFATRFEELPSDSVLAASINELNTVWPRLGNHAKTYQYTPSSDCGPQLHHDTGRRGDDNVGSVGIDVIYFIRIARNSVIFGVPG
ncbi:MAG: hypothetical protein WCJ81_04225 [bacterium]